MQKYNPQKIEKKWQKAWYKSTAFRAQTGSKKKKLYLLNEFPYPSGDGLHVGHCRPYIGLDIIARKKRMEGFNVLYPMGWDAFGLPTENYAIKMGVHPAVVTKKNTGNFRKQMDNLGLSFDWSREVNTTDPKYYQWTQWIFLQLFKHGLAEKQALSINWCPKDKTGLANEEVINGKCERCGTAVEKKDKVQWVIKITKYADRLVEDLKNVDYPSRVKDQQINWIGKSEGAEIGFKIQDSGFKIDVFTTRLDTLFGVTFLVLAPEHPIIGNLESGIQNLEEIKNYIAEAKNKSDLQRQEQKEKTGVELKGVKVVNPATGKEIPLFVADYVLAGYGTGAIMAVPAHDDRDFEFATKYQLPIRCVIEPEEAYIVDANGSSLKDEALKIKDIINSIKRGEKVYIGDGVLINSGKFDGMESEKAKTAITEFIGAKKTTQYKLRDWVFSRQHYWGEPIPMVICSNKECPGRGRYDAQYHPTDVFHYVPVPEKELPLELPKVKKYEPTDTGESPLSAIEKWVNVKCPQCKGPAKRETDTMPNWAGSNWYFMRYTDPKNSKALADGKALKYWMPIDWYNGGMEHTTLHLLYSRFIFKFLWDIGAVPKQIGSEPYKKRTSHGIILGPGAVKMSKSRGNVINPDDVVKQYGADTLRVYEMFMGPFEQMIPWDDKGIVGARRFIEKVYKLALGQQSKTSNPQLTISLNKLIKKVGDDIEELKFNTAISALMTFVNEWSVVPEGLSKKDLQKFLAILSPFAPHFTAELGLKLKSWPEYEEIQEASVMMIISVNGKVRDKMEMKSGLDQSQVEGLVLNAPKVIPWLEGKQVRKIIFVPNKLINIVI